MRFKNFISSVQQRKDTDITKVLTHLNLIDEARITNAAILLFGKNPQKFFTTSEVKCAHFHGIRVSKPIPSHQVYKGDVFEMIDKAVDFVLSKINLHIGERTKSATVEKYRLTPLGLKIKNNNNKI